MTRLKPAYHRFGAGILRVQLARLTLEVDDLQRRASREGIHRLRVVSRRLRNSLKLFSAAFTEEQTLVWNKAIRRLARAISEIRDLDVHIRFLRRQLVRLTIPRAAPGIKRLLSYLRQRRQTLTPELKAALKNFKASRVDHKMKEILKKAAFGELSEHRLHTPQLQEKAGRLIKDRTRDFLAFAPVLKHPGDEERLHEMRIAAKHLRYTLELFSPIFSGKLAAPAKLTARFQAFLGRIHDSDVWLHELKSFSTDLKVQIADTPAGARQWRAFQPGLVYLRRQLRRTRTKNFHLLCNHWERDCTGGDAPFRYLAKHGGPR